MTKHLQIAEPIAPPASAEKFLIDEPAVNGRAWSDDLGMWHSCIDWGRDGLYTDFHKEVTRLKAIRAVQEFYVMNYYEATL
jgi:hypothetical protein